MIKLSIVIPAYNEENFIGKLLTIIQGVDIGSIGFEPEIIVIDDGSKDRTSEIVARFPGVRCIRQQNQGKGGAVRNGVSQATGEYILIQDADLEYDPNDYLKLLSPLLQAKQRTSVYGSRIKGEMASGQSSKIFPGKNRDQSILTWGANICLSMGCFLLYGRYITDTLTGYKVYPAKLLQSFHIKTRGFETDHELTAKLLRSGVTITEVPVSYHPRSKEEGKKIRTRDFFVAVWTFLKFRFVAKQDF